MTFDNSGFHRAVSAEIVKQERKGYTLDHDLKHGIDHVLELAYRYIADGYQVKGAAMIVAARRLVSHSSLTNPMQSAVATFMAACDQEVRKYPGIPSEDVKVLRIRLMVEELLGSKDPSRNENNFATPMVHLLIQDKSDELVQSIINDDLVGIADGIADVLYVVIGTAVAYGINIQEVFDEVHRSNMSKTVWNEDTQTYTTIKDEGGKVVKPETYSPAQLERVVQRQITLGMIEEAEEDPELEVIEINVPDNA